MPLKPTSLNIKHVAFSSERNAGSRRQIAFCAAVILALLASTCCFAYETMSLAGSWRFALDRTDVGIAQKWFAEKLPEKIQLPGILESQGYGNQISIHTPWVLTLYDHFWYLRADYAAYKNAGHVKVPFLCQPPRHYLGAAWYQRDFEIPESWQGKHISLFLERPHWQSTVWLDGKEIGFNDSLVAPHEYDFGILSPGEHHLSIRVDNRMILPYRPDAHSVSDSLDGAWNGIVGKIELRVTPPVWIDDVQIFPHAAKRLLTVKGRIRNLTGTSGQDKLVLNVGYPWGSDKPLGMKEVEVSWSTNGGEFRTDLDLSPTVKLWDEFHPNLYVLDFSLMLEDRNKSGGITGSGITFGLRDFHTDGNQFILNGRPIYFRGTHDGGDFPLTGYPPTDVASWKKVFQTCQDYGLNHMRFHSWCPPEAAFEAADELGFYLQVECGMWNSFSPGGEMEKQLYLETERILRAYGNHPSLMLISASNEAHGRWQPVLTKWVKHFRAEDPRHLYTPDTGWSLINSPSQPINGGADYLAVGRIGLHRVRGESGWFGRDFRNSVTGVSVPVIAHEVGQWCAYPNFDIIKKFTGFMRPGNYVIFRDSARKHGVLEQDKNFAWASGRFQLECYKEEIEANLRTPGLEGFQLLDLHDYVGQGTALVGLLDTFWQTKGYVTPAEFREFCSPVVPLARLTNRAFTTADKFDVPVEVANFGPEIMTNAQMAWTIRDWSGKAVVDGASAPRNIPIAKGFSLGKITTDLSNLPAPAQYKLVVTVGPQPLKSFGPLPPYFQNDWNFWLYPAKISDAIPPGILFTSSWTAAQKRLAGGGKVLFLPRNSDLYWDCPPLARVPIFWNRLMNPAWSRMLGLWCDTNSPALAEFPTEANCDWQWTTLLRNTRAINLEKLPSSLTPIVSAIDDWNRSYKLGVIFQAKVGQGKLLVCSIDLEDNSNPVAEQLRRSLLDYMASARFQPQTKISPADFLGLHFNSLIMRDLGTTARAEGRNVDAVIDGDPNTYWLLGEHRRGAKPVPFPHQLTITFPKPVAMNGLVLMSRQNDRNHFGETREFKIETSHDGKSWNEIKHGELLSTWNPQRIEFGKTVTARQIRFVALDDFGDDSSTALAELAVIYAGPELPDQSESMEYRRSRSTSSDVDE